MATATIWTKQYNSDCDALRYPTSITVTGTFSNAPGTSIEHYYHWHFYLVVDNDQSVMFDCIPGMDGQTGILNVTSKATARTRSSQARLFKVMPTPGRTIQSFLDFILMEKLHMYRYSKEGSGCHHWCTVVLQKWEEAGFVELGSMNAFLDWICELHELEGNKVPLPELEGTFYGFASST